MENDLGENAADPMAVFDLYKVYEIEASGIDAVFKSYKVASNIATSVFQAQGKKDTLKEQLSIFIKPRI